ncbi:MAG TPA: hypothetical protein DCL86_12035 [Bacteroidales bacterium]|jgi:hypothetical protein|nr:hypothetical protein [Bacteroidales bacterium]
MTLARDGQASNPGSRKDGSQTNQPAFATGLPECLPMRVGRIYKICIFYSGLLKSLDCGCSARKTFAYNLNTYPHNKLTSNNILFLKHSLNSEKFFWKTQIYKKL